MNESNLVVGNLVLLGLLALIFIGTAISTVGGLGLMIGATIVTFANIVRL